MSFERRSIESLVIIALLGAAACSHQNGPSNTTTSSTATAGTEDGSPPPAKVLDCATVFTPADVAAVMAQPATISHPTDLSTVACVFKTADTSVVQVSWDGDMERALFSDPNQRTMGKYLPTAGLGDEAYAKVTDDGAQIFIRKGKHYCAINAGLNDPKLKGDAQVKALGALCDKVFAALG